MSTALEINGELHELDIPEDKPLLWVLREDLGLKGAKYGCGRGLCGACTVLVNGQAMRSCITPAASLSGLSVQTVEGLDDAIGESLKSTWCERSVAQCGYCQPGQIVAAHALLSNWDGEEALDLKSRLTNLCRCGTYCRIRSAVQEVADGLGKGD